MGSGGSTNLVWQLEGATHLSKAQRLYDVRIHAVAFLSNHWHGLLSPKDAWHLAGLMNHVQGNLAREAGDLHDWKGPFWGDRYHVVLVSEEPEVQYRRLSYCLAQGAKEGLVAPSGALARP